MRFFQLASKARLVACDAGECEEAILEVTRKDGPSLQILDRLSLGVQQLLYFLDDFIAMGQEQQKQFDVSLKRHLARTLCGRALFRCRKRMNRFPHHDTPPESEAKYWLNRIQVYDVYRMCRCRNPAHWWFYPFSTFFFAASKGSG